MEFGERNGGFVILGIIAGVLLLEAAWIVWRRRQVFDWRDAAASFGVGAIKRFTDVANAAVIAVVTTWVYENRLWTIRLDSVEAWVGFFVLFEFVYYWHHRWAHEIRWLWATHSVHHSPNHMNLSVSVRLGWTGLLSGGFLVFLPIVWLGFHPLALVFMLAANLFYQIWLHTEVVPRLGPLEWILNTPSHHRVHHATNPRYLDRNYGGVLIVFDRLFGTFAAETKDDKPVYGLVNRHDSRNPVVIALREWWLMARDLMRARCIRDAFLYLFGPPGWSPDDSRQTSRMIAAAAGIAPSGTFRRKPMTMLARAAQIGLVTAIAGGVSAVPLNAATEARTADQARIEKARAAFRQMADRLKLTRAQRVRVAPILRAHFTKLRTLFAPYKGKWTDLPLAKKLVVAGKARHLQRATRARLASILSEDQLKAWDVMRAERRARFQSRRRAARGAGSN